VLILVGAMGFSIEEAAETCGCAPGTVKSRANRGRRALADMLGLDDGEGMDLTENTTLAVISAQAVAG
jgi:RNA polymerase sigma-70 factor, ECF subfamily